MVFQNGKPPAGGFTLIELLVVSTVLAVLLGLSVGFLGRTDPDGVAASVLAGELRAAQLTARAEGLPTEVLVLPGADGAVATVQSRVLQPVVAFHFEPGSAALDDSLRPTLGGEGVPAGRFGHARRNRPGERTPLLRWAAPPEVADLGEGGALRVDLRLDARGSCVVLRLGGAVDLQLDDSGRPRARLRLSGGTAGASNSAALQAGVSLPVGRWCTLDVACDGRFAWLALDGRELARAVADGRPLQDEATVLEVSPGDAAVPGLVDEVRVFRYAFGAPQNLPSQLQPDRRYRIAFDARGEALGPTEVRFVHAGDQP